MVSNNSKIIKSVSSVMILLLVVKFIGFIKQAVIAYYFGTTREIDTFLLVSEFMENLGTAVFSAISVSFLTIYVEELEKKGRDSSSVLTCNVMVAFLPLVAILTLFFLMFPQTVITIIAPGFTANQRRLASKYIALFAISIINMFICSLATAVLEGEKTFVPGKIVGIIRSICVIIACVFFSHKNGIYAMLIGVLAFYMIETVYLLMCMRKKVRFRVENPWKDKRIKNLIVLSFPLFISYGSVQLQGIVDKAIGSGLPAGSISALSYSSYLFNMVHSIIIGSICTVLFSYFTSNVAKREYRALQESLYHYIKLLLLLLFPIVEIILINSKDIVDVVYGRGHFDETSISNTAVALCAYSIGIIFIGIRDLLIRAHYAFKDTRQAMINGVVGVIINIFLSLMLSRVSGFVGVALATSLSSMIIAFLSLWTIRKYMPTFSINVLKAFIIKSLLVFVIMLVATAGIKSLVTIGNCFIRLVINAGFAGATYILLLKMFKFEELDIIERKIKMRLMKG